MNRYIRLLFLILIIINLWFCAWFVLQNDLEINADIGRDFFILKEISIKKIILIGPRSSAQGLFHGPLWAYLNFPAYWIGKGNPIIVGWFWILLIITSLVSYFLIAKKLFNELSAWLFVLMISLYFYYHARGLFNPHGAFFLFPLYFYLFIRYIETNKIKYLISHIFCVGLIIQFQMAIGMPLCILSFLAVSLRAILLNHKRHILLFFLLIIPLCTYVIFELLHNFPLSHAAIRQIQQSDARLSFTSLLHNRLDVMVTGIEFLRYGIPHESTYVFIFFLLLVCYQLLVNNMYRQKYLFFLYLYIGFFILSLLNRYYLLYFYVYPIFPLVFLFFSSLCTIQNKIVRNLFLFVFGVIYIMNTIGVIKDLEDKKTNFSGISQYSWKALFSVASTVYTSKDPEFGYFVFSPDIFAYEGRYAMDYGSRYFHKMGYAFEKKSITFLVAAPENGTNMSSLWWSKNKVHITSKPIESMQLPGRYTLEKYQLSPEDISIPFDSGINPGLHFR